MNLWRITSQPVSLWPLDIFDISEAYIGWLNDPAVTRFTEIPPGQTRADIEKYVHAANDDQNAALWRVMVDGAHVGNVRISSINRKHRRAEIAVMIGREYWGHGYATEAVRLASAYAFDTLGMHRLQAGIYAPNAASIRVFEKAGFTTEAVRTGYAWFEGSHVDCLLMAKVHR